MRRVITLLLILGLFFNVSAQDSEKKVKDKKEKTEKVVKDKASKEKKDKGDKVKKRDAADVFIAEPENSEDYQVEDRRKVSKTMMPDYDEIQGFNQKTKKKQKQEEAYLNEEYYYPAKPKNAWQIGVNGGIALMNGDVNQNFFKGSKPLLPGYTFGVNVKKPFSYIFSGRLSYKFIETWNTDWEASTLTQPQRGSVINLRDNYAAGNPIFHNSHSVMHDATLDGIISLGNTRFHKERTNVVFNVILSAGGLLYQTWYDHLDENGNPYDYTTVASAVGNGGDKKETIEQLQALRNGVYETPAEGQPNSAGGGFGNYTFTPAFGGGFGITFRLNRIMDLDLESKIMFTRDDLLDGVQWEETGTLTRNFDTYATTTLGLNFKLVGKNKTEPTTLLNPMHYTYQKLAEADPERAIDDLLQDDDGDGVPNRLDEEDDTPEGAPVDPKGRALDSDKDGIIDLMDEEPFSAPGYPINENGVAQIPPPPVPEVKNGFDCEAVTELPSVHFDKDKYYIRPEFYAHMHNAAEMMMLCPDMKVVAVGMTDKDDNEKYNEQLSWNRVNAVIDYMTEKYGIERSRFIVNYDGEASASGTSSIEQYKERKVSLKVAGSGDAGNSNPAAPHPGIKAGSNK